MANSDGPVLLSGEKTVAAAGTAEALVSAASAAQRVKAVVIIAKGGNTGRVYLGGSDVDSATNDGLGSGGSVSIEYPGGMQLSDIYLDVDTSGEGVDFYAVQ